MQRLLVLTALAALTSALALAETWTGRLVDAGCAAQQKDAACAPTTSTTSFAIDASGTMLKLNVEGNKKAAEALKKSNNGANREKDADAQKSEVTATIQGTLKEGEIDVESIEVL